MIKNLHCHVYFTEIYFFICCYFITIAQTIIVVITLYLGYVTGPFLIQETSFFMLLLVFLANEVLYPHDSPLTYKASLITILLATVMSEALCVHEISNVTSRIDSRSLRGRKEFTLYLKKGTKHSLKKSNLEVESRGHGCV